MMPVINDFDLRLRIAANYLNVTFEFIVLCMVNGLQVN